MMSKIIHQIWLGDKKIPEYLRRWMATWKQYYPEWEYYLWTDAEIRCLVPEFICAHVFEFKQNPGLLSDVVRMELLHKFGGLYVDCDFECLESMEHLLQDDCFHYGDEWPSRPATAFMCSPPSHPVPLLFLRQLRHGITRSIDIERDWTIVVRKTGPESLARVLNYWVGDWAGNTLCHQGNPVGVSYPGKVVAFWQEIIYPYSYSDHNWRSFSRERYPRALAAHHWAGSWHG